MAIVPTAAKRSQVARYIYIACPWTPVGGGMYKVADYLIQSQVTRPAAQAAQLRPLDTRGAASPVLSLAVLATALAKIAWGRLRGGLAGVHVNMGERMSLFRKGVVVAACHALGVPVVLHLHAEMEHFYLSLRPLLQRLTRKVFLLASGVVVIGPVARRFVLDVLQVPASRVEIVINGVPRAACESVRTDAPKRVLFLGNLSDRKGLSDLLRALAHPALDTSGLEVIIAGGGDVSRYRRKARALGLDGVVHFEGWCDQAKADRLLAASHVLVLPSHTEVLPLVVLEALAHGVAVVTTAVGEIPALLDDGVNALFVRAGDPASIAEGLQQVLREPATMERLVRNGRALYEDRFSLAGFFSHVGRVHKRYFGVSAQLGDPPMTHPS